MEQVEVNLQNGEVVHIEPVHGYSIRAEGIFDEFDQSLKYSSLCWVDSSISFIDDDEVYRVVKGINNTTGNVFEIHLSNAEFMADYKSSLLNQVSRKGVEIEYGEHKKIMQYLAKQRPSKRVVAVRQIGWHRGIDGRTVYIRPDKMIGYTEPSITLLSTEASVVHGAIRKSCSLEDEQLHVSNYCAGNPMLIFAMGIAYASVMMKLLDIEGGGFHFYGHSSRGKTTILQLIAFVLGDAGDPGRRSNSCYIQSWDSTNFAIELMAKSFNDTAFLLDELHKYSDSKLASLVYSMSGGKGRARGSSDLSLRRSNQWLNMIGSTGEYSIPAAIAKIDVRKVTTGQQIRIQDILVEDDVFIQTHGMEPKVFVEMLKANCAKYFGASGEKFIESLVEIANDEDLLSKLQKRHAVISSSLEKESMTIEQARVTPRFGAVMLGLEMANELGLINIPPSESKLAVEKVLDNWLEGVSTLSDIDQGIVNIRTFIRTQPRRFRDANDSIDSVTNIVGYRDNLKKMYFIIPEKFEEVCGKSHTREILRALKEKGFLKVNNRGKEGKYKYVSRQSVVGEVGRLGVYAINYILLDDDCSDELATTHIFDGSDALAEVMSK